MSYDPVVADEYRYNSGKEQEKFEHNYDILVEDEDEMIDALCYALDIVGVEEIAIAIKDNTLAPLLDTVKKKADDYIQVRAAELPWLT